MVLVLLVGGGVAQAAPITPPAGWTLDSSLAPPPSTTRFGGATTKVSVWAYRASTPGAVLHVNRAEAELAAADRDRLASLELEEPRNSLRRQAGAKAEQDAQRYDAAKKQMEAQVSWRDASLVDSTRLVIAADEKRTVVVTGQCVLAIDAAPELVKACEAALATLDPEIAPAERVAMSIVATMPDTPKLPSSPDVLDDGGRLAIPPIVVAQPKPERDMRPVYLGAGLMVLAALAYWNRKRREKFEPEREPIRRRERRPRDEDADDLHAAAEASDDEAKK